MDLKILFEDDHIIVIDKPAGLAVHPGAGDTGPTLVQGLLYHVGPSGLGHPQSGYEDPLASLRPGIVHRLDKDTSGVMVCAKSDRAHADLAKQFQDKKTLRREYGALLDGRLSQDDMVFESWLKRDPVTRVTFASSKSPLPGARYAKSHFRVEEVFLGRLSLVKVRLFTGRTHQIRVHAKDLGAPIIGDLVYHRPTVLPAQWPSSVRQAVTAISRQLLHARLLSFRHPLTQGEMAF
jgi:23S rRNA pseudouridine1911/1915/1917 synthase